MSTRLTIQGQVYTLLRQSATDSNFTTTQINTLIDEAIKAISPVIEQPRKFGSTQAIAGTAQYAVPSDFIALRTVYFGDRSINGDSKPLTFIKEETLRQMYPNWRATDSSNRARPRFITMIDEVDFYLYPTPDTASAVSGKLLEYNYIYQQAALSGDSSIPVLPLPYHDILKFYVCHLCYLSTGNADLAALMYAEFLKHHKEIQLISTIESRENMAFEWGFMEDLGDSTTSTGIDTSQ